MDTPDIMKTTDLVTSQPTIVNDPVNRGHKAINNKACEEDQPAMVDECSLVQMYKDTNYVPDKKILFFVEYISEDQSCCYKAGNC